MEDRPTASELLGAVADLLTDEVQPTLEGGLQHKVRVAANLCRIVERELRLGPAAAESERLALAELLGDDGTLSELNAVLTTRLQTADDAFLSRALPVLIASVAAKLEVDKPGYAKAAFAPVTVEAPWATATREGLARFLGEQWGASVTVTLDGVASTGARRRNVLFTADDGRRRRPLVATIIQNDALLIQDFALEPGAVAFAAAHGVPVAGLVGASDDPDHVGGPFFVTERVDGETVPRRVLRLIETERLGPRLARQFGAAFAALHRAPVSEAPAGLLYGEEDPAAAALERVTLAMAALLQPSPVFALAFRWLELHRPTTRPPLTVVHGDFRIGNVIVGEDGLRAVLDWEIVRFGDPMEDLAWTTLRMWRFGNDDLEVGGFATVDELAAAYAEAGGTWDADRFAWWQVLGTLRWGIGLANQAIAHLDGSVPSVVMAASGRRVGEQEFDVLTLVQRHLAPATPR